MLAEVALILWYVVNCLLFYIFEFVFSKVARPFGRADLVRFPESLYFFYFLFVSNSCCVVALRWCFGVGPVVDDISDRSAFVCD